MGFYNFPHTINYDSDLGWLIERVKQLTVTVEDWKAISSIKFADPIEWADTNRYEPYTIVLGPDGNSYLSIKYVPAGVDVRNTEYWERVANTNAQLETVIREITILQQEVAELRKEIETSTDRNIIFIGDSYGDNTGVTVQYPNLCAGFLGLDNEHFINKCVSGAGFCNGTTFIRQLQAVTNNRDKYTDIVVLGGVNDMNYTENEIETAINEFMTYAKNNFINAVVTVGMISWSGNVPRSVEAITNFKKYLSCYQNASKYGARIIANAYVITHNYSNLQNDLVHPNDKGEYAIAYALASFLNGGDFISNDNVYITPTITASEATISGSSFNESISGQNVIIQCTFTWNPQSPKGLWLDNSIQLATITGGLVYGNYNTPWQTIPVKYHTTANVSGLTHVDIVFTEGAIIIKGIDTIANIDRLEFDSAIVLPLMLV